MSDQPDFSQLDMDDLPKPGELPPGPRDRSSDVSDVPRPAFLLGIAGAIPFVALCLMTVAGYPDLPFEPKAALLYYGAVILAFLGGIHWGLAMARWVPGDPKGNTTSQFTISVCPSIVALAAAMLRDFSLDSGLILLALAFAALATFDHVAVRQGEAPTWYPKLRWPLSLAVICALLLPVFL